MGVDVQIDIGNLDASHRRALEEVIGRELTASQRLVISVSDSTAPTPAAKPAQSLDDWTRVYDGLSDDAVEEIDAIIKTRANLTRPLPYLSSIIKQLVELRNDEETDEYGVLRASDHAFETACQLMTDTAVVSALVGRSIPRGCASTDSEGGVRIDWLRPNAAVCLFLPATKDREPYIYHEVAGQNETEPATPEALARCLREIP